VTSGGVYRGAKLTCHLRLQNAAHLLDRLVKDIVTESTSFSVEAFIPLLRERLAVLNPYVRQFLVGWITVLDGTPDIHMVEWLPHLLDGLLNMLSDPNREIRQQARDASTPRVSCGAAG
jgi:vacuole morphology and inheritance protein 14